MTSKVENFFFQKKNDFFTEKNAMHIEKALTLFPYRGPIQKKKKCIGHTLQNGTNDELGL